MRAVLQSAYTVTTGLGNIIDVTVMLALSGVLESRVSVFFIPKYLMCLFLMKCMILGVSLFLICWSDDGRYGSFGLHGHQVQVRQLHRSR